MQYRSPLERLLSRQGQARLTNPPRSLPRRSNQKRLPKWKAYSTVWWPCRVLPQCRQAGYRCWKKPRPTASMLVAWVVRRPLKPPDSQERSYYLEPNYSPPAAPRRCYRSHPDFGPMPGACSHSNQAKAILDSSSANSQSPQLMPAPAK